MLTIEDDVMVIFVIEIGDRSKRIDLTTLK